MKLNELTIKEASQKLEKKEISSKELVQACLGNIDKRINAFITVFGKYTEKGAEESDKRIKKGERLSILDGVPLAIKDNIVIKNTKTTAGSKILENFVASYDATVISKLKRAGAIFLGKTNMDEFAMGSSTETSYFGPTLNPCDKKKVPGGSSGGSAAAVADNECIAALGSDTGGSIRQPASFCGVVGLKPTYGQVSRYGLLAMGSSLDQIGSLTKNVEDAAILLNFIAGSDRFDSTAVERKIPDYTKNLDQKVKGLKIGIPKEYFKQGIDSEVRGKIESATNQFSKMGAKIKSVNLSHTRYALACYYIIMPAEASTNLARYDGIKYGYSVTKNFHPTAGQPQVEKLKTKNLLDVYLKSRACGFGNEVKRRIMLGTYTLSAGYYEAYYLQAQKVRALVKKDFDKVFQNVDVLVGPTSPTTAFKLGEKLDDPLTMYLSDIFTVPINIAGLPAISIPCGQDKNNLPIGLQIIGPAWSEEKILNVAYQLEQAGVEE
jgi:aspartyl-tRNA(Asn)/glutamyl-tRNA(Gln) amidotransferase subunit A